MKVNKTFNGADLKKIRKDLENAVKDIEKEYSISIKFGKITYSEREASIKTNMFKVGEGDTPEKIEFEKELPLFNVKFMTSDDILTVADFNKDIKYNGELYKLVGLSSRSPKYPIIARSVRDNNKYKLPITSIKKREL